MAPGPERAAAHAQHEAGQAQRNVDQAEADLQEARRAAPVPAGPHWRRRSPADGIPLWALVDFAGHMSPGEADRLEGALLVSGILDALVTPDGLAVAGDLSLTPAGAAADRTLADPLEIETGTGVDREYVRSLLRAVPVDAPSGGSSDGTLVNGVLTAAAPTGYRSKYIGRTTRERARLARVAALESALAAAKEQLQEAQDILRDRKGDVAAARAERDAFPSGSGIDSARAHAARLRFDLAAARQHASALISDADLALQRALADLDRAADARSAALTASRLSMNQAAQAAADAEGKAEEAASAAAGKAETARRSEQARRDAETAQRQADGERDSFPAQHAHRVRAAHHAEDEAARELERARAGAVKAAERHRLAGQGVRDALRKLNDAAALPGGGLLPTTQAGLDGHRDTVIELGHQVELWDHAARRTIELLHDAARGAAAAARGGAAAAAARQEAQAKQLRAARQAAALAEARTLYGAEYAKLAEDRTKIGDELAKARARAGELMEDQISAGQKAAAASSELKAIEPQRESAGLRRDNCLRDLGRLTDEGLADMPEDLPAGESGHPANLQAALTWARPMLGSQPGAADRLDALTQAHARAMTSLENSARNASTSLARFGRQVAVFTIEGTDWRRAIVADPEATRGEDLHQAVEGLRRAAEQLDSDLREDVKPNLRQVLALLCSWDFDVLATAPSMTPLIKREAGRAVVHQVIPAGKHRMTVPWLWEGHGEPQPLTLELPASGPAPQPQGQE